MARHNETGKKGEQIAVSYLLGKGFEILETNWRHLRAEIDIIAKEGAVLVFVEVKTRSSDFFGRPEVFVSAAKEDFMAEVANIYMEKIGHEWEIRFDIIAILLKDNHHTLEHFRDAFFPMA